jgi:hypothetical protein
VARLALTELKNKRFSVNDMKGPKLQRPKSNDYGGMLKHSAENITGNNVTPASMSLVIQTSQV